MLGRVTVRRAKTLGLAAGFGCRFAQGDAYAGFGEEHGGSHTRDSGSGDDDVSFGMAAVLSQRLDLREAIENVLLHLVIRQNGRYPRFALRGKP